MGMYDVPAIIDYILEKTKNKQLLYIGHSMGCTMFYVMSIMRPEYNDKILGHISLAPVTYFAETWSLPFKAVAPFANELKVVIDVATNGEILSRTPGLVSTIKKLCLIGEMQKFFCLNMLFFLFGKNEAQIPTSLIPDIMADIPAGASMKTFVHYEQLINSNSVNMTMGLLTSACTIQKRLLPTILQL
uniref:Lipase 1 n=1 Tax=Cacopsylla melanoneura TaxID=428564 RepID=A0A8D9EKF8_9HEMI